MKKIYSLILLLYFTSSILKAEHFFDFYFHKMDVSDFPTITVYGLVDLGLSLDESNGLLNGEQFIIYENEQAVSNIYFDYLKIEDNRIYFEVSYLSTLAADIDRMVGVNPGICAGREYTFIKSSSLQIPNYSYEAYPRSFIPAASFFAENYFSDSSNIRKYVLAARGLDIKSSAEKNSEIIGRIPYGEEISIDKNTTGNSIYEGEILNERLYGNWHRINYNGINGYVLDTYLSFLPPRRNYAEPLIEFLQKNFGDPIPFDTDPRGNELVFYDKFIVYNKTQIGNSGYIYFTGLNKQQFIIVVNDWFYNETSHYAYFNKDSKWDNQRYVELLDSFGFSEFQIGQQYQFIGNGAWQQCSELKYSVKWSTRNATEIKGLLDEVSKCKLLNSDNSTDSIIKQHNDSIINIPFNLWKTLKTDRIRYNLFNPNYTIDLIARSRFREESCFFIFRCTQNGNVQEWLGQINADPENPGALVLEDVLPIGNDTIKCASFQSGYSGVYLDYKSDTTKTWKRFYGISLYGFDKLYHERELTPQENAKEFIENFDFSI